MLIRINCHFYINKNVALDSRRKVLALKNQLLLDHGKLVPNGKPYNYYKTNLLKECKLTPFQYYALVGLLLSDASLQYNNNKDGARIKMQQSIKHGELMEHITKEVFPEYNL